MSTKNPVPSIDPSDILFNSQKLDEVVNGGSQYYTDRMGVSRRTVEGINAAADVVLAGLGYAPPVAYASGIALTLTTQTVEYSGAIYAPKAESLPFTTSGTFETSKFRPIQGVASTDLAASGGSSMVGHLPSGTGAVATTVQAKLRETVSVSGFDTVQDAVAHAYINNVPLYWPSLITVADSIPNFHSVKHFGPGGVIRGTDTFYVDPTYLQVNTLYVDPAASLGNDGLSASQPINLMDTVFAALKNYGPVLNGKWLVKLAASSAYDYGVTLKSLASFNQIVIEGPDVGGHPNVPSAVVGPSSSTAASGWRFTDCSVKVRNVKFINFRSSASAFSLAVTEGGSLETDNVHVNNDTTGTTHAGLGIVASGLCVLKVRGGIIERCAEGIRSLFDCYHSIGTQNAGNLLNGPVIRNNIVGFSAREASSGHSDWVTYEDNEFGISSEVNARINCSLSDFRRNTVAIRVRDGNVLRTGCTYNLGTADANTEVIRSIATGTDLTADGNSLSSRVRYRDVTTVVSLTGSINETALATYTLTAGEYTAIATTTYVGKCIRVTARGVMTGTNGTKSIRLRFGGIGGTNMNGIITDSSYSGRWEYVGNVFIRGNEDQRNYGRLDVYGKQPLLNPASTAHNMAISSDTQLALTFQLGNASDIVILDFFQVEIEG